MSDNSTNRILSKVEQAVDAPMFLSSFFRSPPENLHNSEKVSVDIIREEEDIAIPVPHITSDGRLNESSKYVNKEFTPPIFKEIGAITAWEQAKRQPGQNPFEDPNFARNAGEQAVSLIRKLVNKERRAVELMSAQVMKGGTITLIDSSGNTIYSEDFTLKAAHFTVVGTTWALDGSAGNPLSDVGAHLQLLRRNGKRRIDQLIFGRSAWQRWMANANVRAAFDKTILNLGDLNPANRSDDATYMGKVWVGTYLVEMWLYDAEYKHPQTGTLTPYVDDDHVLFRSSKARMDLTFGSIPQIVPPDARSMQFLGNRMSLPGAGIDVHTTSWCSPDGSKLFLQVGTRPLTIPTEGDAFGRLDVTT